jgi:hypothetical protein
MSSIGDKLNTLETESTPELEPIKKEAPELSRSPADDILEVLDISKTPKNFSGLQAAFNIFGRKYFKSPMRLINDDIRLLDKNMKEIPFDIRTISIKPFDIEIKTFFNENNRKILTDLKQNETVALVSPKYEHFINFSKDPASTYITCLSDQEPVYLNCVEINVVHKLVKNGKIIKETPMF